MDTSSQLSLWRAETFWTKEVETITWLKYFSNFNDISIDTFVDVGSNIGIYSLYWLSKKSSARVIACEPFKENMNLLKTNLDLNLMTDRATLVASPLYSESVSGTLLFDDMRPGSSGTQFTIEGKIQDDSANDLISTTVDEILFGSEDRTILKIDVDGLDFDILKGARRSLELGTISSVLIEAADCAQSEIADFLSEFNLVLDQRFNEIASHSDGRRIAAGKAERNRVYSHLEVI
jgi:protein O-GlcNAc transferase